MSPVSHLSDEALLCSWEEGRRRRPLDRARTVLRHALPPEQLAGLDSWSLGRRDAHLLEIYAATFGERIEAVVGCVGCGETLDLAFRTSDISSPYGETGETLEVRSDDSSWRIAFRLPTAGDLHAVQRSHATRSDEARRALAERCILQVQRDGLAAEAADVPGDLIDNMGALMAAYDQQSDVWLDLACPSCGHAWKAGFDIADYLWRVIGAHALRLVNDVHTLARAYGWTEWEILAMPGGRRQLYLDLVTA